MSELVERLRSVHDRVAQLLRQHRELRAQLDRIGSSERESGQRIAVLETRIAELEKENEVLRTAKARQGSEEGQGTKQRIDELVNEIDRCLALLNN
ncbi:MAG: hypothetical protein IPJ87_08015 [Flavobacteriales bacterium]|jgi:septal ring factor EnvC (AmiA/AmiB activator)|nr:hypothetical protein [Flavobacteriales bacterium]MBK7941805.1 hypothetical protein [Flavobacteriales bacterium]MBK8947613.1 hypothetical protein [Flavobacteriales bacterium]MBK9700348.1 hypothetical protein [Flavobacteriales bacterium]